MSHLGPLSLANRSGCSSNSCMFIVCIQLVDVRNGKTQTISGDGGEPDCCSAMREWTGRDTESVKIADFGSGQARLECPCSMGHRPCPAAAGAPHEEKCPRLLPPVAERIFPTVLCAATLPTADGWAGARRHFCVIGWHH